jgi:hypothetical protein
MNNIDSTLYCLCHQIFIKIDSFELRIYRFMSTNKFTEHTPVHDHYRSDALIATGATISVLILGGVLQFLSPKTETIATDATVSQSMTSYSETASPTKDDSESFVEPAAETTAEMPLVTEELSATSETPAETPAAVPMEPAPAMEATVATITDAATIQALNSQVYNQIDQTWTQVPTFTQNLVYQVNVTESGAIASYEPITQSAKDYSNEIPLPSLIDSDSNSDKMAKFVVLFTPGGLLEVSPWIAN